MEVKNRVNLNIFVHVERHTRHRSEIRPPEVSRCLFAPQQSPVAMHSLLTSCSTTLTTAGRQKRDRMLRLTPGGRDVTGGHDGYRDQRQRRSSPLQRFF